MPDPTKVYDGRPCKHCGETLRWRCDRSCVACTKERAREHNRQRRANDPEYRERIRERERLRMRKRRANDPEYREYKREYDRKRICLPDGSRPYLGDAADFARHVLNDYRREQQRGTE